MSEKTNLPSCHRGPSGNASPSIRVLSVRMTCTSVERALCAHRLDLRRAVAEDLCHHLVRMLPEGRRGRLHFARRPAHPPRDPAMLPLPDLWMLAVHEIIALGQVRIV